MKLGNRRLDDWLNFVLVAVAAALAMGLQVAVSAGYALDRGSSQAHAGAKAHTVRMTEAASAAEQESRVSVARAGAEPGRP